MSDDREVVIMTRMAGGARSQPASIGLSVHYIGPDECHYPATVVRVYPEDPDTVDLVVLGMSFAEPARKMAAVMRGSVVGSWHWAEFVPPLGSSG